MSALLKTKTTVKIDSLENWYHPPSKWTGDNSLGIWGESTQNMENLSFFSTREKCRKSYLSTQNVDFKKSSHCVNLWPKGCQRHQWLCQSVEPWLRSSHAKNMRISKRWKVWPSKSLLSSHQVVGKLWLIVIFVWLLKFLLFNCYVSYLCWYDNMYWEFLPMKNI